ncbi:MAG: MBL fold metallo-hydrolase [Chloroflexota bacterium]
MSVEVLSPLVTRVLAPNPSLMTLQGTNTYLVGTRDLVVIDPGPDMPEHVEAIISAVGPSRRIVASLVTHRHGDHLPAAHRLRERIGAPVRGHAMLPGVTEPLVDAERVSLAGAALTALHTPGHTRDHLCFRLAQEAALFSGDLIAGTGTVVVGDEPGDLGLYLESLRRVASLDLRLIYPGHGPVVADSAGKVAEYIEHRESRIREVFLALQDGVDTVEALVARIYPTVNPRLVGAAGRNVRACLDKLAHDGLISPAADGRYRPAADR